VLSPGGVIPLYVFESRYRALMRRCIDNNEPFGVVMIERGSEVGGGEVRSKIGCLANVVEHEEMPDGRWAVIAVGAERIVVEQWLADDPYPRATVTRWPDVDEQPNDALILKTTRMLDRVHTLARSAGYEVPDNKLDLTLKPSALSHQACLLSPVGPHDRQQLLACAGPVERLEKLCDALDGIAEVLEAQQ
jgi:Lon protease-like protein